jgi:hypothetical protein
MIRAKRVLAPEPLVRKLAHPLVQRRPHADLGVEAAAVGHEDGRAVDGAVGGALQRQPADVGGRVERQALAQPDGARGAQHGRVRRPGADGVDAHAEARLGRHAQAAHQPDDAVLAGAVGRQPGRLGDAGDGGDEREGLGARLERGGGAGGFVLGGPHVGVCETGKVQERCEVDGDCVVYGLGFLVRVGESVPGPLKGRNG